MAEKVRAQQGLRVGRGASSSAALVLGCAPESTSTLVSLPPSPPQAPCGDNSELLHQDCIYQKLAGQQKRLARSWGEKEESWEGISPGW